MSEFDPKTMTPAKYAYATSKLNELGLTVDIVRNVSRAGVAYFIWVKDTLDALPEEVKVNTKA